MGDYLNTLMRAVVGLTLSVALCGACRSHDASPPTAADVFGGQRVRIIVGFPPGGGYDLHARVFATALTRHLPGQPSVVVENMPGAGGLIAANYLAFQAAPDGLTMALIGGSMVLPQVIGDPGARYDVRSLPAVGAPTREDSDVCVTAASTGLTLDNWGGRPDAPRVGISTYGSRGHADAVLLTSALGLPIRLVPGYGGTSDLALAMQRGEVDVSCLGWGGYQAALGPTGLYRVVFQSGAGTASALQDVPSATRLATDERGRALVGVLSSLGMLDRYYALPPETPRDRVDILRTAFDVAMEDDEFLQQARAARLEIHPVSGAAIDEHVASIFSLPDDIRRDVTALLTEQAR